MPVSRRIDVLPPLRRPVLPARCTTITSITVAIGITTTFVLVPRSFFNLVIGKLRDTHNQGRKTTHHLGVHQSTCVT